MALITQPAALSHAMTAAAAMRKGCWWRRRWPSPPPTLLLLLLLLPHRCNGGQDATTKPKRPLGVPERTLTFESYYADPSFRPHMPLYTSEVDVVSYIPDRIVSIWDRTPLPPLRTLNITQVWMRPRQSDEASQDSWVLLDEPESNIFELSVQQGKAVLIVDMASAASLYEPLGSTGTANHYDPVKDDDITPFTDGSTTDAQRETIKQQVVRQKAKKSNNERLMSNANAKQTSKLPEILGLKYVTRTSLMDVDYSKVVNDLESQPMYFSSLFIYDFTLIIETSPGSHPQRLDLTILPRVDRDRPTATFCDPTNPEVVSSGLKSGLPFEMRSSLAFNMLPGPESAACHGVLWRRSDSNLDSGCSRSAMAVDEEAHDLDERPVRSVPRVSSKSFEDLHPEEAYWLEWRLDRTSDFLSTYIKAKLGRDILPVDARLGIAVVHGGEGKRGAVNSMGVASALWDLGVYSAASWSAASSGASWFLASWYAYAKTKKAFGPPADLPSNRLSASYVGLTQTAVSDEFNANEAYTDRFPSFPPITPVKGSSRAKTLATRTDRIFCDAELKLNAYHALEGVQGVPSFFEYINRALALEFLDPISPDAIGFTLSGLVKGTFLTKTSAPLPLFQVHEKMEGSEGKLWELTPYDFSVHKGDLHASFPTERIDSNVTSRNQLVTQFQDTLPFVAGLSSNLLPTIRNESWAEILCAPYAEEACGPIKIHNPFKRFEPVKDKTADPGLYDREYIHLGDGGRGQSLAIWPFVTRARPADIIFAIDASGGSTVGKISKDTNVTRPDAMSGQVECLADGLGKSCPAPDPHTYSLQPDTLCCDYCKGPEAASSGCWPADDPSVHSLFSLPSYSSEHTLPPMPTTIEQAKSVLDRVVIFGCDDVKTSTGIVYIPNRIVTSGAGGHPSLKGILSYNIPSLSEHRYSMKDITMIYENGARSLPDYDGLPDFGKCLACLYYASAKYDNTFMSADPDCRSCYDAYCYKQS